MPSFSSTGNLEFHSVGTSLLMILGLTSQRYLSIMDDGILYGSVSIFAFFFAMSVSFTPVYATPEEIWKRCFHSENEWIKCFSSKLRRRNLKTQQSPVILDLCLKILGKRNHVIIVTSSFLKRSVFKLFSVHTKTQSRSFQIPPVWRAPFSWRIRVDGRPNRRNKAVF